jgi:hypothetical protein
MRWGADEHDMRPNIVDVTVVAVVLAGALGLGLLIGNLLH